MKITPIQPPRVFRVGLDQNIELRDCARLRLAPDEQVTFTTESGAEHDVVRKSWGFYATASTNARLPGHGLRPLLAVNAQGQYFVLLVEAAKEAELRRYLTQEHMTVVCWLDGSEPLAHLKGESA
jgi:hypothetical protein